jgi:hypothetical protein
MNTKHNLGPHLTWLRRERPQIPPPRTAAPVALLPPVLIPEKKGLQRRKKEEEEEEDWDGQEELEEQEEMARLQLEQVRRERLTAGKKVGTPTATQVPRTAAATAARTPGLSTSNYPHYSPHCCAGYGGTVTERLCCR